VHVLSQHFRYYRSVIESDIPLPTVMCEAAVGAFRFGIGDVPMRLAEAPYLVERHADGETFLSVARMGSSYLLRFPGSVDFLIDPDSKLITASPGLPASTLAHFLLDQVLPRYLSYLGASAVHASSVSIDGRAALFLGNSGRGKSTLATELHFRGHPAIADDVTFIEQHDEGFWAVQSYPGFRLWPDSAHRYNYPSYVQVPVAEDYAKRRLVYAAAQSHTAAAPIACIFVMTPPDPALQEMRIRPVPPATSFPALLEQCFPFILDEPAVVRREFEFFAGLAGQVPAFTLDYPRSYAALDHVAKAIIAHVAALP
jgi:hypothetical protein